MWHLDGSYNRPACDYLYAASAALYRRFLVSLLSLIVMIGTKPSSIEKARVSELMAAKNAQRLSRARKASKSHVLPGAGVAGTSGIEL